MANTVVLKRSAVASKVPLTTDLALGELAVNTYDGKLYMKKDNGSASIVEIGAGGGATVTISDTPPSSPAAGDLWWESDVGILKVYYTDASGSQWVDAVPAMTGLTQTQADSLYATKSGAWERISGGYAAVSSSTTLVSFTLPSTYLAFRFTFTRIIPSATGYLYFRISTDNGSSFYSGASDYALTGPFWDGGSSNGFSNSTVSYGGVGGDNNASYAGMGQLLLDPGSATTRARAVSQYVTRGPGAGMVLNYMNTELTVAGRATNIYFGIVLGNIAGGVFVAEGLRA